MYNNKLIELTLEEFLSLYTNNTATVSIKGYCEEASFDYLLLPEDEEDLSDNNPNHYKPTCMALESWWNEAKGKTVKYFSVIGGGSYPIELCITLEE